MIKKLITFSISIVILLSIPTINCNVYGKELYEGYKVIGSEENNGISSYYITQTHSSYLDGSTQALKYDTITKNGVEKFRYIFDGRINNGEAINGTIFYDDGSIYNGPMINNKPEGLGQLTYVNGNCFIGEFKNGLINGHGIYLDLNILMEDVSSFSFIADGDYKNFNAIEGNFKDGMYNQESGYTELFPNYTKFYSSLEYNKFEDIKSIYVEDSSIKNCVIKARRDEKVFNIYTFTGYSIDYIYKDFYINKFCSVDASYKDGSYAPVKYRGDDLDVFGEGNGFFYNYDLKLIVEGRIKELIRREYEPGECKYLRIKYEDNTEISSFFDCEAFRYDDKLLDKEYIYNLLNFYSNSSYFNGNVHVNGIINGDSYKYAKDLYNTQLLIEPDFSTDSYYIIGSNKISKSGPFFISKVDPNFRDVSYTEDKIKVDHIPPLPTVEEIDEDAPRTVEQITDYVDEYDKNEKSSFNVTEDYSSGYYDEYDYETYYNNADSSFDWNSIYYDQTVTCGPFCGLVENIDIENGLILVNWYFYDSTVFDDEGSDSDKLFWSIFYDINYDDYQWMKPEKLTFEY